jgi:hypothetical protein
MAVDSVQGGVPAGPPKVSGDDAQVRKTRDDAAQRKEELRRQEAEANQADQARQAQQAQGIGQTVDTQA